MSPDRRNRRSAPRRSGLPGWIACAAFGLAAILPGLARAHQDVPGDSTEQPDASLGADGTQDPAIAKWAARFKDSTLIIDQSITPDTVIANAQLSAVPSYQLWFSLRPRYYVTPNFSLRVRIDLTIEMLNGTDTTYYRQPMWGDIWLDGVYTGIPKFLGIQASVGVRLLLPTSLASQMRGTVLTAGPVVSLARDFHTRVGDFGLSAGAVGGYVFSRTMVGTLADNQAYGCQATDFTPQVCNQNTGAMDTAFQLITMLSGKYSPIPRLTFSADYILIDQWANDVQPTTISDATGGTTMVGPASTDQRLRQYGWFLANIDVETTKWLTLSLGYYVYRPILNPDSTYGNPFWEPGGATRVYFTVGIGLDQLYAAIATRTKKHLPMQTAAASTLPSNFN